MPLYLNRLVLLLLPPLIVLGMADTFGRSQVMSRDLGMTLILQIKPLENPVSRRK